MNSDDWAGSVTALVARTVKTGVEEQEFFGMVEGQMREGGKQTSVESDSDDGESLNY